MKNLKDFIAGLPSGFVESTIITLIEEEGQLHCSPNDFLEITINSRLRRVLVRPRSANQNAFCRYKTQIDDDFMLLNELIKTIDPGSFFIQFLNSSKNVIRIVLTVFKKRARTSMVPLNVIAVPSDCKNDFILDLNGSSYTIELRDDKTDMTFVLGVNDLGERVFLEVSKVSYKDSGLYEKLNPLSENEVDLITVCKPVTEKYVREKISFAKAEYVIWKNHYKFVDKKDAKPTTDLSQLLSNPEITDEYLKMWAEFSLKERELLESKINRIGRVNARCLEVDYDGNYVFDVQDPIRWEKMLKNAIAWDVLDTISIIVVRDGKREETIPVSFNENASKDNPTQFVCKIDGDNKPCTGLDYLLGASFAIYKPMFDRREEALEIYMSNSSQRPDLHNILCGIPGNSDNSGVNLRLTDAAIKEVYGNNYPTSDQAEAIRVALNTPDIAIIQGPPGTGKTNVIGAIAAAFPQPEDDERDDLFTSYQNVATDNMATKQSETMDFPFAVVKNGASKEATDEEIMKWAKRKSDEIRAKYPEISEYLRPTAEAAAVNAFKTEYNIRNAETPYSIVENDAFLDRLNRDYKGMNEMQLHTLEQLKSEIRSLRMPDNVRRNLIFQLINIPQSKTSFDDGGLVFARMRVDSLRTTAKFSVFGGTDQLFEIIDKISNCFATDQVDFTKVRKLVSDAANIVHVSRETLVDMKLNSKVVNFLDDLYKTKSVEKREGPLQVIAEFLLNLESQPLSVTDAVRRFQDRCFATHQKSVLSCAPKVYRNLFVDEAARSNPIDLLIPLVKTTGKIILVGDQNQLPHYLDDGVYAQMDEEKYGEKKELLKTSFFERLVKYAIEMEKKDGIKRFVKLRTQFRMPKALGDYIGDEFYSTDSFGNTLPESDRGLDSPTEPKFVKEHEHNFIAELKGKPLVFLKYDRKDKVVKVNKSSGSIEEAEAIYKFLIKSLENIDEHKDLSIGIITVYTQQKNLLLSLVEKYKHEAAKRLNYKIYSDYERKYGSNIKVDTVDSFQGGQEDIIIMSMVRGLEDVPDESKIQFLVNRNRINVAMSRAKKCCILAADDSLFEDEKTRNFKSLDPLRHFYEKCKEGKDGIIYEQ